MPVYQIWIVLSLHETCNDELAPWFINFFTSEFADLMAPKGIMFFQGLEEIPLAFLQNTEVLIKT